MKASEFLQRWCDTHGSHRGWREEVSVVHGADVFNMNIVPMNYRPFDVKYIYYTGRIGLIGGPRWATTKHLSLDRNSPWRYGTERLLWLYEDKDAGMLEQEARIALRNMEKCPFDVMWLCDFNMFRVAMGMRGVSGRDTPMFGFLCRKMEDYDPYAAKRTFRLSGEEWERMLDRIGEIEDGGEGSWQCHDKRNGGR